MNIDQLPEPVLLKTFGYLDNETLWNLINTSRSIQSVIGGYKKFMEKPLVLTPEKVWKIIPGGDCDNVPFRNVEVFSTVVITLRNLSNILRNTKSSIEVLTLKGFRKNYCKFFAGFKNLKKLVFVQCYIPELRSPSSSRCQRPLITQIADTVGQLDSLQEVVFERCDGNFYAVFHNQKSIAKITVRNTDWTWNGFPHDDFNALMRTLPNCKHVCFEGIGTGSYFDMDEFPYRLETLEATTISFHWYVGIRSPRKRFMETQKGFLQHLTIHKLPYDFDGGKLLKFLIENMNLNKLYYGDIPLILNGQKQNVEEFTATEIQLTALFEMFAQFPTIRKLKLVINQTDVDSNEIERIINPSTALFKNVMTLEVVDNSGHRNILGVFLGLFKNFRNIQILKIKTPDRNINVLLEEFLPRMTRLEEFYLDSTAPRIEQRLAIVKKCVPDLKKFVYP
jgi:hypothetical protein